MPDQGKRGVKYRRISDDREGLELGVQRQDEDLDALAAQLGITIVGDYCDNDISASTRSRKTRPEYERMVADAKAGKFDVILAYTSKRLTRRPREHEDLIELGEKHGVQFRYVRSPSFDLNTANGRMVARILAAADANESEEMAERVARKHRQLAEDGKEKGGGSRPFGYETSRKEIRESEAALIREATRRILDEGASLGGIVSDWRRRGIPTVTGAQWTKVVLRRMLVSARISGRREHNRVRDIGTITNLNAEWPAIISAEASDRLRELLTDPARQTNFAGSARRYLLSGFLYCGLTDCGNRMKARPQGDHQRSYVCADVGRAHLRMIAEPLETYVQEAVLDYLDEFVNLSAAIKRDDTQEENLWAKLKSLQSDLESLDDDLYIRKTLTRQRYDRLTSQVLHDIELTKKAIDRERGRTVIASLPTNSALARTQWEARDLEWRRRLVTTLVERVTVGPGRRGLNKFDPERVSIAWRRPE